MDDKKHRCMLDDAEWSSDLAFALLKTLICFIQRLKEFLRKQVNKFYNTTDKTFALQNSREKWSLLVFQISTDK